MLQYLLHFIFLILLISSLQAQGVPPSILEISSDSNKVKIVFDDDLDSLTVTDPENFVVSGLGMPWKIELQNQYSIELNFVKPISPGVYDIIIRKICNKLNQCGKDIRGKWEHKSRQNVLPFELLITEIMADPTPAVGLPNFEYIELYNSGNRDINLAPLVLKFENTSYVFDTSILLLKPNAYIILSEKTALSAFSQFGYAHGLKKWPAIRNTHGTISIVEENTTIHSVTYDDSWYADAKKNDGGWSLEMINTKNVCDNRANWLASNSPSGGSPGKLNSTTNSNYTIPLELDSFVLKQDGQKLNLYINKRITKATISFEPPLDFNLILRNEKNIEIVIPNGLKKNTIYQVKINAQDCLGNSVNDIERVIALPSILAPKDLLINEILFDPPSGGVDYLEIFNDSEKLLSTEKMIISNGTTSHIIRSNALIPPNTYWVISNDPEWIAKNYLKVITGQIIKNTIPSMPNEKGFIAIYSPQNILIDSFQYNQNLHYKLLNQREGVALERVENNSGSGWQSAAGIENYGTPTRQNSVQKNIISNKPEFILKNKTFSPGGASVQSLLEIDYSMPESGYVLSARIFNDQGLEQIRWYNNETLGTNGTLFWDGKNENQALLPRGIYVIKLEVFHLNGNREQTKLTAIIL